MRLNLSTRHKRSIKRAALTLTLGLAVFLTDNSNLTTASSFEGAVSKKHKFRLPANAARPVVDLDCASTIEKMEVSTPYETLRVAAKNCKEKMNVENVSLKNKLMTFSVGEKSYSSEFTHLAPGENKFVVTAGKKTFTVSVFRF